MTSPDDRASGPPQPVGRRPGLTRDQVLTTAMAIIDDGGVEELTMRRLGKALDRNPMAIYRHAMDKDALLDGVVELVVADFVVDQQLGRATARSTGNGHCGIPRTRSAGRRWPTRTSCRPW